jgi:Tfp pilus assembly protein PilF
LPENITPDRYDAMIDLCQRVIELDPNHSGAYWVRGSIMNSRKKYDQAEPDFRKVCRLAPAFPDAFGNLGRLLIKQGRWQEAETFCREAHRLDCDSYAWNINLGHVHLFKGDTDQAYSRYEQATKQIPDNHAFEQGPVADFKLFIQNGWQVDASKNALAWMQKKFKDRMDVKK